MTKLIITSNKGGLCCIRYPGIVNAKVTDAAGNAVVAAVSGKDIIIETISGGIYTIA